MKWTIFEKKLLCHADILDVVALTVGLVASDSEVGSRLDVGHVGNALTLLVYSGFASNENSA